MIVSHEHRFIFLKTRKTAGTSVEIALSAVCGERDTLTPLLPAEDERARFERAGRGSQNLEFPLRTYGARDWARLAVRRRKREAYNHMTAIEARAFVGPRVWNSYFKFAISRNPYDVAVSMYHWRNQQDRCTMHQFLQTDALDRISGNFDVYAIDGAVVVDRVLRYDDLGTELDEVRQMIGLDRPFDLPRAKTTVRASADRGRDLFEPADVALVADRCRAEIEAMSFEFDR